MGGGFPEKIKRKAKNSSGGPMIGFKVVFPSS